MIKVLTTKEYKSIKRPKKKRYYYVQYWNLAHTLIKEYNSYDSYNNAWFNLSQYKVLSIKFVGWL
jgi:hypothetical protein